MLQTSILNIGGLSQKSNTQLALTWNIFIEHINISD